MYAPSTQTFSPPPYSPPRQSTTSTTLSSLPIRQTARTESELSPFFTRLDDSNAKPPSLRFSTLSSLSTAPEPNPPSRPETPKEPISLAAFARRQWSRLSQLQSDDGDSVVSEPASYSNSAYVASDLWLVQKDVPSAERELSERGRKRRERVTSKPQRSWTAEYRNDEFGSSRLISQFFSGRNTPVVGPTRKEREWSGVRVAYDRGYEKDREPDRERDREPDRERDRERDYYPREGFYRDGRDTYRSADGYGQYGQRYPTWEDRERLQRRHQRFQEQEFGPFVRRRFSRARKFRWWIRRVTHRVREDWEDHM